MNTQELKLLSTKDVIEIATELGLWYNQPHLDQSIPAQRLKTRLKKFADRIQLLTYQSVEETSLTAEQIEDRIPDID